MLNHGKGALVVTPGALRHHKNFRVIIYARSWKIIHTHYLYPHTGNVHPQKTSWHPSYTVPHWTC